MSFAKVMRTLGLMCAVVAITAGCATEGEEGASVTAAPNPNYAFNAVKAVRHRNIATSFWEPRTLKQALPNVAFTRDGSPYLAAGEPWDFSRLVAEGYVTHVRPLSAEDLGYPDEDGIGSDHAQDPGDDDPPWPLFEVSLRVTESQPRHPTGDITFRFGNMGTGDDTAVLAALRALDHVLVVLDVDTAGRWYPVMSGALVGVVHDDGMVTFPALGDSQGNFVNGLDTVQSIMAAASAPPTTIAIDPPQLSGPGQR